MLSTLYSCSTTKKASPNAILDVEYSKLQYNIIQKSNEDPIEFLIFFSKEKGYNQFQSELRSLNLLVPTHIKEITYIEGVEAVNTYGQEVTNGVMVVKSDNNFELFLNTLEIFGIPFSKELYESNSLYFKESEPILIGGLQGLQSRISYPEEARKEGIEGRVIVQFIVTEEGEITDLKTYKHVHHTINREAFRLLKGAKFIPGIIDGKPKPVQYSLPVNFRLR